MLLTLQCPVPSAVVVPTELPLLDSVTVLLASAVPAMLIEAALVCAGIIVVITGAAGGIGGGDEGDGGGGAGGTKNVSMVGRAGVDSELNCDDPVVFAALELEPVASSVSVKGIDKLLSDGEKLIGRAPPGKSSKLGFVVEPFCPAAVGPFIAVKPTENV